MICVIVASMYDANMKIPKDSFIIAADKGYEHLVGMGITPDLTVGDFDSLGYVPKCGEVLRSPAEKDDTDTLLAVREGLKRGFKEFIIYGGSGGRFDHTFANIQTLSFIKEHGASAVMYGENTAITLIENEAVRFPSDYRGYISVFSYGEKANGVTERGLKYSLCDAVLSNSFPVGVSNEFTGEESEISVRDGKLLIIWQTK